MRFPAENRFNVHDSLTFVLGIAESLSGLSSKYAEYERTERLKTSSFPAFRVWSTFFFSGLLETLRYVRLAADWPLDYTRENFPIRRAGVLRKVYRTYLRRFRL